MRYLVLLLIPVIIFVFTFLIQCILDFALDKNQGKWWSFPLYMTLMTTLTGTTISGTLVFYLWYFGVK